MNYLLYGKGISNKSVKKYFDKENIKYDIFDDNNIDFINLDLYSIIIKSPGIPNDTEFMKVAKAKNKIIISDLELYNMLKPNQYKIVVSGSNGKTTVTSMLKEVLEPDFTCGGNIGIPLFDVISDNNNGIIIEASSYMLEYTKKLKPNVYVLLNLEKHHQSHHKTFNAYIKAKLLPLRNMLKEDIFIYEYENKIVSRFKDLILCRTMTFSLTNSNATCYIKDNSIYLNNKCLGTICNFSLSGIHNLKNYLATILTLYATGNNLCLSDVYLNKLYNFKGLSHRLEIIQIDNYKSTVFINDSKSTNLYSLIASIDFINENHPLKNKVILIGGKYNNENVNDYVVKIKDYENVILFSEAGKKIYSLLNKNSYFSRLEDALNYLFTMNLDEFVVLFSPSFQSFDEFKSFENRGCFFKEYLKRKEQYN